MTGSIILLFLGFVILIGGADGLFHGPAAHGLPVGIKPERSKPSHLFMGYAIEPFY